MTETDWAQGRSEVIIAKQVSEARNFATRTGRRSRPTADITIRFDVWTRKMKGCPAGSNLELAVSKIPTARRGPMSNVRYVGSATDQRITSLSAPLG